MRRLFLAVLGIAIVGRSAETDRLAQASGEVLALRDVLVAAEVNARVVRRPADETAAVKQGEVVIALDATLLEAVFKGARASVDRAKARHDWAVRELDRAKKLYAKGSVGEAEHDSADVAVREAVATVAIAEAASREADERLQRTRIQAPFTGRLVRVLTETGAYLRVGEPAFRIVDLSALRVVVFVPGRFLHALEVGQTVGVRASFETDAKPRAARVFSIAPAAEGAARTFRVEARLTDDAGRLRPGMAASLVFDPPLDAAR